MSQPLLDLEPAALAAAIRANHLEYFRYLGRSPQSELHDGPPVTWSLTHIPHPFMNHVLAAQLAADNVDDEIARTLSYLAARNVTHFSWWIGPDCRPSALAERLLAHGMVYTEGGPGMAADLSTLNERVPVAPDLSIRPVTDIETLRRWVAAFCAGFGLWESRRAALDLFAGLGFDPPLRGYVGIVKGEPVATAQLFLGAGVAGIYCVSTVPEARRQGIGAAVTLAALREARESGYRTAVLTSSPMGFGVYRRLGFVEVCRMGHFYQSPPAA